MRCGLDDVLIPARWPLRRREAILERAEPRQQPQRVAAIDCSEFGGGEAARGDTRHLIGAAGAVRIIGAEQDLRQRDDVAQRAYRAGMRGLSEVVMKPRQLVQDPMWQRGIHRGFIAMSGIAASPRWFRFLSAARVLSHTWVGNSPPQICLDSPAATALS